MSNLTREEVLEILSNPPENGGFYDFRKLDLSGLDLSGVYFKNANLTSANLIRADLTSANLTDADLTRANLTSANLTSADLIHADLTSANLTSANLTDANLTRANLTSANLTSADLIRANLTDANLTRANLIRADLRYNLNNDSALLGTTIRGFYYPLFFHPKSDLISIGCKTYTIAEWLGFNDEQISNMDRNALSFLKENKEKVKALFEIFKGEKL